MGKTILGGDTRKADINLLTPEQQNLLSGLLTGLGPQAQQTFQNFLGPMDTNQLQDVFQQAYVDPAMQTYQRQVLPAIQERFLDQNASSSSALNQALAQSATDLSTALGSQYGNLFQNQNQMALQALSQFLPLLGQNTFTPHIQQTQGILGPLVQGAGQAATAAALSSEKAKENIEDCELGIESLRELKVKKYDYKEEFGGQKDKIGLIAEEVPGKMTKEINGYAHVDLYEMMSMMVNSLKNIDQRLTLLEEVL